MVVQVQQSPAPHAAAGQHGQHRPENRRREANPEVDQLTADVVDDDIAEVPVNTRMKVPIYSEKQVLEISFTM